MTARLRPSKLPTIAVTLPQMQADNPTFAIIVTEKGGGERREVFQTPEMSVGRVQGNELTLPKGNVSKRHARLLFRDGRFIITDLNSTNGTYVNRRRISQATIVRDGDRIYIGDFVLRIEPASDEDTESMRASRARDPSQRASGQPARPLVSLRAAGNRTDGLSAPSGSGQVSNIPSALPAVDVRNGVTLQPSSESTPEIGSLLADSEGADEDSVSRIPDASVLSLSDVACDEEGTLSASQRALRLLIDRVLESLAPGALDKEIDERLAARFLSILQEQFDDLVQDGELPGDVPADSILADARAELLEMGPVTRLLEEASVREIRVLRFDRIQVVHDDRIERAGVVFTSNSALLRAIRRLCHKSGAPLRDGERFVRRTLPDGTDATAVIGPAAPSGAALSLRRHDFARDTLSELVDGETMSAAMAKFLQQSLVGGLRILVVGAPPAATSPVMSALCRADTSESVAAIMGADDWVFGHARATKLDPNHEGVEFSELLSMARRLASRVVLDLADSERALELVFSCAPSPVTACLPDSSASRGLARLVPLVAASRSGLSQTTAASLIAASFDLVAEVTRCSDGGTRVTRIAEVVGSDRDAVLLSDIYAFEFSSAPGATPADGSFVASSTVPQIVAELSRRGVDVDPKQFCA